MQIYHIQLPNSFFHEHIIAKAETSYEEILPSDRSISTKQNFYYHFSHFFFPF